MATLKAECIQSHGHISLLFITHFYESQTPYNSNLKSYSVLIIVVINAKQLYTGPFYCIGGEEAEDGEAAKVGKKKKKKKKKGT